MIGSHPTVDILMGLPPPSTPASHQYHPTNNKPNPTSPPETPNIYKCPYTTTNFRRNTKSQQYTDNSQSNQ